MDLRNDPHYQNGFFKGRTIILNIDNTTFGSIEKALEVKRELVDKLTKQYGWDETHQDVAELLGTIAALEEEQSTIESNQPTHQLIHDDVVNIATSIGLKVTEEQSQEILNRYPEAQENDSGATWDLVIEHLIYEIRNE